MKPRRAALAPNAPRTVAAVLACGAALALGACATVRPIPGTTVEDTKINRELIELVESYRRALEARDPQQLLALASPEYYEDSGTPKADDDYGFDGLKSVLESRLQALRTVRYNIEYRRINLRGRRAEVDVRYDASYQMSTAMGDRWERKRSDNRFVLENDGRRWAFISGM